MKVRSIITMILALFLCGVTAAQGYYISTNYNTNLRSGASLTERIVQTALKVTTLHVVGEVDRWLTISINGSEVWMASWVSHTRVEASGQASTQTGTSAQTDNCCFVDRQCQSDQQWVDGYWAFQNGQCAAPTQTQTGTSEQPADNAPAQTDNCCFVDRQCHSDQQWIDGYWAYLNGQCGVTIQSESVTPVQPAGNETGPIDNCCYAGWHCNSDQEWTNGYWAYQNNQCDAPAQSRSGNVDNCCNAGWNCIGDQDWANGQWAFQNNVCVHPSPDDARQDGSPNCCYLGWNCAFDFDWMTGRFHVRDLGADTCGSPTQGKFDGVIIEGSATFVARVKQALALIKRRSPEWYAYSITAALKIREVPSGNSHALQRSMNLRSSIQHSSLGYIAGVIVHENCHLQRWLVWVWRDYETEYLAEEAVCDTVAINALRQIAPGTGFSRFRIGEFLSRGLPYDVNAGAQREWERAILIHSRRS